MLFLDIYSCCIRAFIYNLWQNWHLAYFVRKENIYRWVLFVQKALHENLFRFFPDLNLFNLPTFSQIDLKFYVFIIYHIAVFYLKHCALGYRKSISFALCVCLWVLWLGKSIARTRLKIRMRVVLGIF